MMVCLGSLVDFGHEVVGLLLRDPHRLDVQGGAVDDGTSGTGGLDGHVDHGMQVERHRSCGKRHQRIPATVRNGMRPAMRAATISAFYRQPMHDAIYPHQPSHAGNVGAAARAMKTMGFDDLVLVAPALGQRAAP